MHSSKTLGFALTLFLSVSNVQAQAIIPYKDGQCTQPVTDFKFDGNTQRNDVWDNKNGWPQVSRYSNPSFPGAEAKTGGGYNVYWKIDQPGPSCRVAIMAPYSQPSYGSMAFPAPPGNVILVAGKAGCYFSSIPQGVDIVSTFCCGTGDCAPISVGNSALLKREDASPSLFSRESAASSDSIVSISSSHPQQSKPYPSNHLPPTPDPPNPILPHQPRILLRLLPCTPRHLRYQQVQTQNPR